MTELTPTPSSPPSVPSTAAAASAAPRVCLRAGWGSAIGCLLLALAAIPWFDRPIADFAHLHTQGTPWIQHVAELPAPLFVVGWPVFFALGAVLLWRRTLPDWLITLWLSGGALGVAVFAKAGLKHVFGRTWPDTWTHNNPSYLHDGVFEFRLFAGDGAAYASFPSGHLTVMLTFATVVALRHRALRWPCAIAVAATAFGQIASDYHWTSDALAGAALGISVGTAVVAVWERLAPRLLGKR